ncbi:unannotated protein [freshwater metagenome]|uniref:Unannotated protein n=1 Tax=freshwater metagenome TaxID=449393 RepID=A0A6J6TM24_9ZZZZ
MTFWLDTAPTPERTFGHLEPTDGLELLIATPKAPVRSQRAAMLIVISRETPELLQLHLFQLATQVALTR